MADEDEKTSDPKKVKPIKLTDCQRGMAIFGGSALVATGAWSSIASGHDGAGTVAFVTAGTLSGLLGIIGRVPTKLSGKDIVVEMSDEVDEVAETTVSMMSPDQVVDLVKQLDLDTQGSTADNAVYKAAASSLAYEQMVQEVLRNIAGMHGLRLDEQGRAQGKYKFDFRLLNVNTGHSVFFEVRRSLKSLDALFSAVPNLFEFAENGGLIIVTKTATHTARLDAKMFPEMQLVEGQTRAELHQGIERALQRILPPLL